MADTRQPSRSIRTALLATGALLLCLGAASAEPVAVAGPKSATPQREAVARDTGGDPGCAGSELLTVGSTVEMTLEGDTTGGTSDVEGYGCETWSETGPEAVYRLEVTEPTALHVRLESEADLDLFLLDSCEADDCLAAHVREFVVELQPRTEPYVLVVDGYLGAEGPFTLELVGYASGVPDGVCASATPIACSDAALTLTDGNLFGLENRLLSAPCGSFMERGGEAWYAVTVPPRHDLRVSLFDLYFDGALWLFDGCDAAAECFGYADGALAEGSETLAAANETTEAVTWYLAVDAFQAVSEENGFLESDGFYSLEFVCESNVPNETSTWGSVKSVFR